MSSVGIQDSGLVEAKQQLVNYAVSMLRANPNKTIAAILAEPGIAKPSFSAEVLGRLNRNQFGLGRAVEIGRQQEAARSLRSTFFSNQSMQNSQYEFSLLDLGLFCFNLEGDLAVAAKSQFMKTFGELKASTILMASEDKLTNELVELPFYYELDSTVTLSPAAKVFKRFLAVGRIKAKRIINPNDFLFENGGKLYCSNPDLTSIPELEAGAAEDAARVPLRTSGRVEDVTSNELDDFVNECEALLNKPQFKDLLDGLDVLDKYCSSLPEGDMNRKSATTYIGSVKSEMRKCARAEFTEGAVSTLTSKVKDKTLKFKSRVGNKNSTLTTLIGKIGKAIAYLALRLVGKKEKAKRLHAFTLMPTRAYIAGQVAHQASLVAAGAA